MLSEGQKLRDKADGLVSVECPRDCISQIVAPSPSRAGRRAYRHRVRPLRSSIRLGGSEDGRLNQLVRVRL
jgi:hypothetical protein